MADISDKGTRRLPYPLLNPLSTNQDTPDEAISFDIVDVFPVDPDEKIDIKINLSLNEYVAIASAVDVGRDIAYSEDTTLIWWLWTRIFKGLADSMSCDDVADCIETSEAVQEAIATNENIVLQNLMNTANSGIDNPKVDSATDTIFTLQTQGAIGTNKNNEIKPLPNCSLDMLWAGIRDGIVQRLDDNARSVLQYLVSKADGAERANALIGAIPIFGSMAQAVLEQMIEIAPDMLNLYESYSSIDHMDEIACEIFGLVCAECRYPTFQEVFYYYANLGITGINDLDDITIALATDLFFGSTETVALMFYHTLIAYELLVLFMGSKFYGYSGTDAITTMASLGEDFANDNWELLCDSCNESYQIRTWDYTVEQYDSAKTAGYSTSNGTYVPGLGWRIDNVDNTSFRTTVGQPFDPTWRIRSISYRTSVPKTDILTANVNLRPIPGSNTSSTTLNLNTDTSADPNVRCRAGLAAITNISEFAISLIKTGGIAYLERLTVIFDTDYAPAASHPTSNPNACDQF